MKMIDFLSYNDNCNQSHVEDIMQSLIFNFPVKFPNCHNNKNDQYNHNKSDK